MASEKETPKSPRRKRIGHIRLSGRELVDFFQQYESPDCELTAETKRHKFSNIEDMEENLPLLQGKTVVTMNLDSNWRNSLTVTFDYCTTIDAGFSGGSNDKEQVLIRQKLEADLKSLRTPILWVFTLVPWFGWWALAIGVLVVSSLVPEGQTPAFPKLSAFLDYTVLSACILSICVFLVRPVYFSSRDTFWQRNNDKIVVGILMLFVGVLAKWFFDTYFGPEAP